MKKVCWLLIISAFSVLLRSQQVEPSRWEGEWGEYQEISSAAQFPRYSGGELRITGCKDQTCQITVAVSSMNGHCGGSGEMQIETGSSAVVRFKSASPQHDQEQCSLSLARLEKDGKPYIELKPTGSRCSFFCTENFDFEGSFPLRSREQFYGNPVQECFIGISRARMAICSDKTLADLEDGWMRLSYSVADLEGKRFEYTPAEQKILNECDIAADPKECLTNTFQKDISDLNQRKKTWEAQVTEPGDRAEASRQIGRIVGTYERTFESGDISGDSYQVTDKLQIVRASENSINFDAHLNFYNGHECNGGGTAEYKKNGAFVLQRKDPSGDLCVLEVIPSNEGVRLEDPTGKCRLYDCGARGGWGAGKFSFSDRKPSSDTNRSTPK